MYTSIYHCVFFTFFPALFPIETEKINMMGGWVRKKEEVWK